MEKSMSKLSNFLMDSIPEKKVLIAFTAPGFSSGAANTGMIRVVLNEPEERKRSQNDIVNMVQRNLYRFPEVRAFPSQEQTISVNRRGGMPVQFVVQNNDFEKIKNVLPSFWKKHPKVLC
jgi:multidrug efflux pump